GVRRPALYGIARFLRTGVSRANAAAVYGVAAGVARACCVRRVAHRRRRRRGRSREALRRAATHAGDDELLFETDSTRRPHAGGRAGADVHRLSPAWTRIR